MATLRFLKMTSENVTMVASTYTSTVEPLATFEPTRGEVPTTLPNIVGSMAPPDIVSVTLGTRPAARMAAVATLRFLKMTSGTVTTVASTYTSTVEPLATFAATRREVPTTLPNIVGSMAPPDIVSVTLGTSGGEDGRGGHAALLEDDVGDRHDGRLDVHLDGRALGHLRADPGRGPHDLAEHRRFDGAAGHRLGHVGHQAAARMAAVATLRFLKMTSGTVTMVGFVATGVGSTASAGPPRSSRPRATW